ncbi:serine phosphatase RsbU, regulator of sigma subunit [Bernardetia litoralis DSM 6794]|uniref:Serine phosphatase RsbU, regulator of sigma subunit n=1 Tax=Bernardetia litoralis (strain ATCC 23117 / DSM 6794 / NBRC 15988 / NCIMB 1366 / Fx l1 / Sio-4) TaxID=880071 RepID=I4AH69_BERLS|nr:tetratricopeptide repeat protein [Bernardetia litoralis]AFM03304.1 serine phosphatase RsbU, regulator of sigma subunit [Bernardetia litoralis DSM 6794]
MRIEFLPIKIKNNKTMYSALNSRLFLLFINVCIYCFFSIPIFAQKNENSPFYQLEKGNYSQAIQHAQAALENSIDALQRGELLTVISRAYRYQEDYSMALNYAVQATTQFDRVEKEKEKAVLGKAEIFTEIGLLYQEWLSYDKAIENFEKAKQIYKANQKKKEIIELNRKIAHNQFLNGEYEESEKNYIKLLEEDKRTGDKERISFSLGKLAIVSRIKKPENSLKYSIEKYNLEVEKKNNYDQIAFAANSIGYLYRQLGQEKEAITYFEKALEALKKINKKDEIVLNNLGVTYTALKKYPAAHIQYKDALEINQAKNNAAAIADSYNYLGANEYLAAHAQEARVQVGKAITIAQKNNQQQSLADSYLLLSKIWEYEDDFRQSQDAFKKYTDIKTKLEQEAAKQKEELQRQRTEAERQETQLVQYENEREQERLRLEKIQSEAEKQAKENELLKSENELQQSQTKNAILQREQTQQALLLTKNELEAAKRKEDIQRLEIERQKNNAKLREQALEAEQQKKQKQLLEQQNKFKDLENEKQHLETERQKSSKYIAYLIAITAIILFGFALFAFIQNKKKNKKIEAQNSLLEKQKQEITQKHEELQASEEELRQNSEELQTTNEQLTFVKMSIEEKNLALGASLVELESQKEVIEKKNHDITSSINYAKRIQTAMLPDLNKVKQGLPESFIFFQPRDIVSGDFYWFSQISDQKCVIAACDCTGHGVPGAFMSLIGNDVLNETVNARGIHEPDKIIHDLHSGVVNALNQRATDNRDGMDMTLCVVDQENKKVHFAGAKNEVVYIQNEEVVQLKGDKMPIGGERLDIERFFHKQTVDITAPTTFYMFSDGFQDQFGGDKGRKYMKKRFREFLVEIHNQPFSEQERILKLEFDSWLGGIYSQIDDVLVIGFKVS